MFKGVKQKQIHLNMSLLSLKLEYDEIIYALEMEFGEKIERDTQDKSIMTDDDVKNIYLYECCKPC